MNNDNSYQLILMLSNFIETSSCRGTKHNSWLFHIVAMGTDLWHHHTYDLRGGGGEAWHTVYAMYSPRIISEMVSESLTMEKCDFLKPIVYSQTIEFSVESRSSELSCSKNAISTTLFSRLKTDFIFVSFFVENFIFTNLNSHELINKENNHNFFF